MDENENTPNPDAEPAPDANAGDAAESAANPYDPAGKGGVPDSGEVDKHGGAIPGEYPDLELGESRHEHHPGDDPHAVKVGTDDQGADVFAHHDAAGARFAL